MTMVKRTCGFLLLILFLLAAIAMMAAAKHEEAPMLRQMHRDGVCEGSELYFAPVRGTVLALCGVNNSDQWGGLIWRVTENNGSVILSAEDAYEVTVFSSTRAYWDNVIIRDGYVMLYFWPDVESAWRRYFQ